MAGHIADAGRVDWNTPKPIVEASRDVFGGTIALDPCSNETSIVQAEVEYILPKNDGLADSWDYPTIFVNPPYGRCCYHPITGKILSFNLSAAEWGAVENNDIRHLYPWEQKGIKYRLNRKLAEKAGYKFSTIRDWVKKAEHAYIFHKSDIIMLIPAAVDTKHWQELILQRGCAVNFLRGRVHFDGGSGPAPMACALVYWGGNTEDFCRKTAKLGVSINLRGNMHYD